LNVDLLLGKFTLVSSSERSGEVNADRLGCTDPVFNYRIFNCDLSNALILILHKIKNVLQSKVAYITHKWLFLAVLVNVLWNISVRTNKRNTIRYMQGTRNLVGPMPL
ncbi:17305_t:CDS:2, partial [Dentiscutata heterogama]